MPRKLAIIQPQGAAVSAQTTPSDAATGARPPAVSVPPRGRGASRASLARLRRPRLAGGDRPSRGPGCEAVRDQPAPFWAMESLLREYPISSAEGLALMRLAEALLRVPDAETAIALTADQLGRADFDASDAERPAPHAGQPVGQRDRAVQEASCPRAESPAGPAASGWARRPWSRPPCARSSCSGRQFVLGRTIGEAMGEAAGQRKSHAQPALQLRHARRRRTHRARRAALPRVATASAIDAIAGRAQRRRRRTSADGISIKLSALFPRYEDAQRERVFAELLPRVWSLIEPAARANINLTIDAEESDRLELSLDVFEALAARIAAAVPAVAAASAWRCRPTRRARWPWSTRSRAIARRARPALHGAPGQGRLLGRRDQARAGAGPAGLPGVHAQAPHRHLLPGLRARADRPCTT